MNWLEDVRIWAVSLAIVGGALGFHLPERAMIALTALAIVAVCGAFLLPRTRSSADMGMMMLVGGAATSFVVPMWLVWLLRLVGG